MFRVVENVSKLFALSVQISTKELPRVTKNHCNKLRVRKQCPLSSCACFCTSTPRRDLMEFFDQKKNWGAIEVKCGRSWRKEELRIKSNVDLHKLWYVLLKERNMLLTMEHECNKECYIYPSPERIDKVKESMNNLEAVVRERNKAYFELETGETGERPGKFATNEIGLKFYYKKIEHCIPEFMNTKWREEHKFGVRSKAVQNFRKLYFEKKYLEKKKARNRNKNHVIGLLKRFPNLDKEALQEQYPDVNVEKIAKSTRTRGHFDNNAA